MGVNPPQGKEKMQTRKLGPLTVPVIGMGTASSSGFNVESHAEIQNCRRILDDCLTAGATFLDTSPMYRRAEAVIGEGIRGRRHEFQLATKVYCAGVEAGRAQIQRSFDLLGTDHIEVLQIHNLVDWRTHCTYLEHLKAEGRIDVIGITHYLPQYYDELAHVMQNARIDAIQIPYSLLERKAEEKILPLAAELGIGVIVMRPLVKGRVVTSLKRQPDLTPLREFGIQTWGQAALAWILADPRVGILIPATGRPGRMLENAAAGNVTLPIELRNHVEQEWNRCT